MTVAPLKTPMRRLPSIPEPYASLESLVTVAKALKDCVESLSIGPSAPRRILVQRTAPNAYTTFDIWIKPPLLAGEEFQMSYWDGEKWQLIHAPSPPGADSFETWATGDVALNDTANFINVVSTPSFGNAGEVWLIHTQLILYDPTVPAVLEGAVWNGSSFIGGHGVSVDGAGEVSQISFTSLITLTAPTILTLAAKDQSSVNGVVFYSYSSAIGGRTSGLVCQRVA